MDPIAGSSPTRSHKVPTTPTSTSHNPNPVIPKEKLPLFIIRVIPELQAVIDRTYQAQGRMTATELMKILVQHLRVYAQFPWIDRCDTMPRTSKPQRQKIL